MEILLHTQHVGHYKKAQLEALEDPFRHKALSFVLITRALY